MNQSTAERWVVISAVVTAGVYFYRLVTEGSSPPASIKRLAGAGSPPVPVGAFATAWGFTYLVLAVIASAAPGLGGAFAILIMAGDLLSNGAETFKDVSQHTGLPSAQQALAATSPAAAGTVTASQAAAQAAGEGFSTQLSPPSGIDPSVPVYVPPSNLYTLTPTLVPIPRKPGS